MKKTTLVIMAAGIGSRYGAGIKQLAAVDKSGHIIMDYSIHDAIAAGFQKIVFIIRRDIEKDFREVIGNRIEAVCAKAGVEVAYCFQSLTEIPGSLPEGRSKPWGTGQAVLAAKDHIDGPFAVINADDYYGKSIYREIHDYLCTDHPENAFCMAGFILKNTLSDNGAVTRGICQVDGKGFLSDVVETKNIRPTADGAEADGKALDPDGYVSMNMWAGYPDFIQVLDERFAEFLKDEAGDPLKKEYLLPNIVGDLLKEGNVDVKVLETHDKWIGITYKEDTELAQAGFKKMTEDGVYPEKLWN